jgi:hypothetical protein
LTGYGSQLIVANVASDERGLANSARLLDEAETRLLLQRVFCRTHALTFDARPGRPRGYLTLLFGGRRGDTFSGSESTGNCGGRGDSSAPRCESVIALAASQQATPTSRHRLLWEEEARTIRTNAQSLSPAARHTVRAVLETILHESDDREIAASARSLLAALERLARELGDVQADRRL